MYTQNILKTIHAFSVCIPSVGDGEMLCLGWNIAPRMGGKVFSTVRCKCGWVISTLWMPISFSVNSALRIWMQRQLQGYVCMRDCPPCCKFTCKTEAVCESVSVGALYFLHWASWLQRKQHEPVKGSSVEGNQVLEQCYVLLHGILGKNKLSHCSLLWPSSPGGAYAWDMKPLRWRRPWL